MSESVSGSVSQWVSELVGAWVGGRVSASLATIVINHQIYRHEKKSDNSPNRASPETSAVCLYRRPARPAADRSGADASSPHTAHGSRSTSRGRV